MSIDHSSCAPKCFTSEVRAAPRQRHIPTMLFSTPCASALWGPYLRCPPPAHLGVEGSWDLKKRAVLWVSETWHPQNMFTWITTISNWITCEWWQSAQVNGAHDWGTNRNHGGWSPPTQFLIPSFYEHMEHMDAYGIFMINQGILRLRKQLKGLMAVRSATCHCGCLDSFSRTETCGKTANSLNFSLPTTHHDI